MFQGSVVPHIPSWMSSAFGPSFLLVSIIFLFSPLLASLLPSSLLFSLFSIDLCLCPSTQEAVARKARALGWTRLCLESEASMGQIARLCLFFYANPENYNVVFESSSSHHTQYLLCVLLFVFRIFTASQTKHDNTTCVACCLLFLTLLTIFLLFPF